MALAVMVMEETRLTSLEKSVYGSFLQSDYFTREDFGRLAEFYADGGAWDRLSEKGKNEMSERIWSGVEQGEYTFAEVPDDGNPCPLYFTR